MNETKVEIIIKLICYVVACHLVYDLVLFLG